MLFRAILFAFVSIALVFLKRCFTTRSSSKSISKAPSPAKLAVIGNLHQLGSLPHRSLRSLALRYGPLMLLHFGRTPVLVASSADSARLIMKTYDHVFANRPKSKSVEKLLHNYRDVGFAPYGESGRQRKDIIEGMEDPNQRNITCHKMDVKKLKRTASKEYSRNYRVKQFEYIAKLENYSKSLEAQVMTESSSLRYYEKQNADLLAENYSIKEQFSASAAQLISKQAEYMELKNEGQAMKNFLRGYIEQHPESLEKLHPTTARLVNFTLNQSGSSDHHKKYDDNRNEIDPAVVVFGGAPPSIPGPEPYRLID